MRQSQVESTWIPKAAGFKPGHSSACLLLWLLKDGYTIFTENSLESPVTTYRSLLLPQF